MLGDPGLDLPQRSALGELGGQLRAELRLVAGAAEEHHQVPGDLQRGVPAQVLLDQGEREVDPRSDPGRGGDGPVTDEDRLGVHRGLREPPRERVAVRPVGDDPPSGQQPRLGEQEGPGADRDDPLGGRRQLGDPADQLGIGREGAGSAGHQQGARRPAQAQVLVGQQPQPAGRPHRPAAERGGPDPVRLRDARGRAGPGEHLRRTGHVEALHSVEQNDEHIVVGHALHPGSGRGWRQ